MTESKVLDELESIAGSLSNAYVEEWKVQGKEVLAYNCSYMPEEIIHAAGLLPFRMKGTGCGGTALADTYLAHVNCSFCRACLDLLMQGKYDFLDGLAFVDACDHMHVMYVNWKAQNKTAFIDHMISVPHTTTDYGQTWYREELQNMRMKIEEHFKVEITDARLREAITVCNETRCLQNELYARMGSEAPPLSGSQCLSVIVAGTTMPRDLYNQLLKRLLNELKDKGGVSGYKRRLMISGSVIDDPALLKIIEDTGGLIVSDTLCFGARSFQEPVHNDGDPLDALAERYYSQILCPRMFDAYDKRIKLVLDIAKRSQADGVVLQNIKNCDCHGVDNVLLERDLKREGIPVLVLEREYEVNADAGRIRTRVQAFIEKIK
jgi:benzoyl-CoA reductase subunit C